MYYQDDLIEIDGKTYELIHDAKLGNDMVYWADAWDEDQKWEFRIFFTEPPVVIPGSFSLYMGD